MIKAIIFDVDGTLLDSEDAIFEMFNRCLESEGFAKVERDEMMKYNGNVSEIWLAKMQPAASKDQIMRMANMARDLYAHHYLPTKVFAFPKTRRVLNKLKKKFKFCIVTNQTRAEADVLDKILNFSFRHKITANDVKNGKPSAEPLLKALKLLGVKKDEAVYVGDTQIDVLTGQNAGVKTLILRNNRNVDLNVPKISKLEDLIGMFQGE
jgi:pyrophosphatase PpaX